MRPQGLKPALIMKALRGAEAPLLHLPKPISEFSAARMHRAKQIFENVSFNTAKTALSL